MTYSEMRAAYEASRGSSYEVIIGARAKLVFPCANMLVVYTMSMFQSRYIYLAYSISSPPPPPPPPPRSLSLSRLHQYPDPGRVSWAAQGPQASGRHLSSSSSSGRGEGEITRGGGGSSQRDIHINSCTIVCCIIYLTLCFLHYV